MNNGMKLLSSLLAHTGADKLDHVRGHWVAGAICSVCEDGREVVELGRAIVFLAPHLAGRVFEATWMIDAYGLDVSKWPG